MGAMTPEQRAIFDWLVNGAPGTAGPVALLDRMCPWLVETGVPVERASAFVRTLHPELMGRSFRWERGQGTQVREASWAVLRAPEFLASPIARVFESGAELRVDALDPAEQARYGVVRDLARNGITDYLVLPLALPRRPGARHHLRDEASRRLHRGARRRAPADLAAARAHGRDPRARAHGGEPARHVRRPRRRRAHPRRARSSAADTEDIRCVIWFSDLRGFTELSIACAPSAVIRMLNEVFDCQVPRHRAARRRGAQVHGRRHARHLPAPTQSAAARVRRGARGDRRGVRGARRAQRGRARRTASRRSASASRCTSATSPTATSAARAASTSPASARR